MTLFGIDTDPKRGFNPYVHDEFIKQNGCGGQGNFFNFLVPNKIFGVDISDLCCRHDRRYFKGSGKGAIIELRDGKLLHVYLGGNKKDKDAWDRELKVGVRSRLNRKLHWSLRHTARTFGYLFYYFPKKFGNKYFNWENKDILVINYDSDVHS